MSENGTGFIAPSTRASALLVALAWCSACGSGSQEAATPRPIAGCEALDVAPCDTQNRTCQLSRLELAACLRGTTASRLPTVSVLTEQEYVEYINRLYEGSTPLTPNHFEVAMTWIGLARPGAFNFTPISRESISDWFGTYRWRQKDLLIIDHGKPSNDAASNVALVSALIQALRDRDVDIGAWSTIVSIVDVDSNWGGDAMYFGEGQFYSSRYGHALAGTDPGSVDELAKINDGIREDTEWIRSQPSTYVATNDRFAPNFGARLALLAWRRGGVDAVNALFDSKFVTQQLMAGETMEGEAPPLRYHPEPLAPSEWAEDPIITALGAWGVFLSLSRTLATDAAWALALDWRGDQIYVYKGSENTEDTALVWQIEVEDETSASALERELKSGAPAADVRRNGTSVTLAMTNDTRPLDWAFVAD